MPSSHKATGRSKKDLQHIRLYHWILRSDGFRALSCAARCVLIEIAYGYHGNNNGRLGLSVRTAAHRCRLARGTASRAFRELQEVGFIECMAKGAFSLKSRHASEWRLTWLPCNVTGDLPRKQFMRWPAETKPGAKISRDSIKPVPKALEKTPVNPSTVVVFDTAKLQAASG